MDCSRFARGIFEQLEHGSVANIYPASSTDVERPNGASAHARLYSWSVSKTAIITRFRACRSDLSSHLFILFATVQERCSTQGFGRVLHVEAQPR